MAVAMASHATGHIWCWCDSLWSRSGAGCGRCLSSCRLVSFVNVTRSCLNHVSVGVVAEVRASARFASYAWNKAGLLDAGEAGLRHLKGGTLSWRDASLSKAA